MCNYTRYKCNSKSILFIYSCNTLFWEIKRIIMNLNLNPILYGTEVQIERDIVTDSGQVI
jgi:hypothetical protein